MKYFGILMTASLVVCFSWKARSVQSLPSCMRERIIKTTLEHHQNPCGGGEKLSYVNCYNYLGSTLFELVFERTRTCPDFISRTVYYDSACNERISVTDGGLRYRHTVLPAGTDLRLLQFTRRIVPDRFLPERSLPDNDKLAAPAGSTTGLSPQGRALQQFYLSLQVEQLWIAGQHVDWETGVADKPDATSGNHTHCSAFAASACKRLNIYLLRPPEHKQILLANAQYDWLTTSAAADAGWKPVTGGFVYEAAQSLANRGMVVIAVCQNPDPRKPGHAALVMPADLRPGRLEEAGPELIMAGVHNHNKITLKAGFHSHLTGWPEHVILFYYNTQIPSLP
jgi:hypothetical protein